MPCNRATKISPDAHDLAFQGITFISLYISPQILAESDLYIAAASKVLILLLSVQAPAYNEFLALL